MTGFSSPNYTQTPNDLFDHLMAEMGDAELRVVLTAVRLTLGYHKRYDAISLTKFEKMTGLSRQGVIDGIEAAVMHGLLREVGQGKRGVKLYELVINVDQSSNLTSQDSDESTELTGTGQASRHTKEISSKKKSEERKDTVSGETAGSYFGDGLYIPVNGNGHVASANPSPGAAQPPSRKEFLDAMFEAIAQVWNTRAGGWVGNMRAMMQGEAKKGDWKDANFNPPVTPDEILAFGKYAVDRKRRENIKNLPTVPSTIQRWFYDYRASLQRAGLSTPAASKVDPTPGAVPLKLSLEEHIERAKTLFGERKN